MTAWRRNPTFTRCTELFHLRHGDERATCFTPHGWYRISRRFVCGSTIGNAEARAILAYWKKLTKGLT